MAVKVAKNQQKHDFLFAGVEVKLTLPFNFDSPTRLVYDSQKKSQNKNQSKYIELRISILYQEYPHQSALGRKQLDLRISARGPSAGLASSCNVPMTIFTL